MLNTIQANPTTRAKWRLIVSAELEAIGASVVQVAAAWRIAKGSAYLVVSDLADVNAHELRMLEKA